MFSLQQPLIHSLNLNLGQFEVYCLLTLQQQQSLPGTRVFLRGFLQRPHLAFPRFFGRRIGTHLDQLFFAIQETRMEVHLKPGTGSL